MRMMLLVFVAMLFVGTPAYAKDVVGKGKKKAEKKDDKAATPLRKVLKELKALVVREKAKPEYDKELLKKIDALVKHFEKEAKKPIKLEDLSKEDREKLEAEVRKKIAKERREQDGNGGGGWADRAAKGAVDRSLEGVDIKDEEKKKKVEGMLSEFVPEAWSAYRNGDYKVMKDLRNDLEKRLKKEVGYKKAKQIMNNVNKQFSRRGGGR